MLEAESWEHMVKPVKPHPYMVSPTHFKAPPTPTLEASDITSVALKLPSPRAPYAYDQAACMLRLCLSQYFLNRFQYKKIILSNLITFMLTFKIVKPTLFPCIAQAVYKLYIIMQLQSFFHYKAAIMFNTESTGNVKIKLLICISCWFCCI